MNHFDVTAREWERRFFKKFTSGRVETGLGNINLVESVSSKQVHFRTQRGKGSHGISRERVRAAIAFFLYRRTIMRRNLEQFNKLSSFLMGLLRIMFVEIARIRKTAKGLRLSHWDSTTPIWSRQKRFVLTERGQVAADKVDPSWDGEACMAYNLQWLFRLEEAYHGIDL
ncbi:MULTISPECIES: hypothetical protein [Paenibacillus]|uniref:hypothetical protein n=1 Tax=Paenibacillus TaxID=44249 RepID=UPI0022B87ED1|nr:hypothetical protein [Paenibacillus caseinilyticus]MCZ8517852.1 hypothetical protein [Paenibacillus caseinilyticus]